MGKKVSFHSRGTLMTSLKVVLKSERHRKHLITQLSSGAEPGLEMVAVYFFSVVSWKSITFHAQRVDRQATDITGHNLIDFLDNQE